MNNDTANQRGAQDTSRTTTPTEPQFKPQTYEEWKAAHGFQPAEPPRLEVDQRVKAVRDLDNEDDCLSDDFEIPYPYEPEYEPECEPEYVHEGELGYVMEVGEGQYHVIFDNGVEFWCSWDSDGDWVDIEPVGKSPSELAHEASERERLAAYRQLTLFGEGEVR